MILLRQIRNEALHNTWLLLELFIVGCVMWHVVDEIYVWQRIYDEPMGIDIENVYCIETYYSPLQGKHESNIDANLELLEKIKQIDGVEYACVSYHAIPYSDNNWLGGLRCGDYTTEMAIRTATPEYMQVFRIGQDDGVDCNELAEVLRRDQMVVTTQWMPDSLQDDGLLGKELISDYWPDITRTVGACLPNRIKPHHWTHTTLDAAYISLTDTIIKNHIASYSYVDFCVRALPEKCGSASANEDDILRKNILAHANDLLKVDGLTIIDVTPLWVYRNDIEGHSNVDYSLGFIFCSFMLFCIFMGILGTFWHRTLERRSQIAIMRSLGASRWLIFLRTNAEALVLLGIAFFFSCIACYVATYYGVGRLFPEPAYSFHRFATTQFITFILMTIAVLLACILPALVAYRTPIAVAIREE